ncbi:hypothetical protein AB0L40_16235 [Patulibacter sp. NPDC049589]
MTSTTTRDRPVRLPIREVARRTGFSEPTLRTLADTARSLLALGA